MGAVRDEVLELVEKFDRSKAFYTNPNYNEAQLRQEFVNPLFSALGWKTGESSQVLHEAGIRSGGGTKHPDYSFLAGHRRAFYVETKKPSVDIRNAYDPAQQIRSYGWSGNTEIGILTNFKEFAVYDCRIEPTGDDAPGVARELYLTYEEYLDDFDNALGLFSRESVLERKHRQVLEDKPKGMMRVDDAFLRQLESWREELAVHIWKQAKFLDIALDARSLNGLVTRTINRIVFLRIVEDRNLDLLPSLESVARATHRIYDKLKSQFRDADRIYNSGLFHFNPKASERGIADELAMDIHINDDVIAHIINDLYPPKSLYQFSVISADILGQVYERFLGKVIQVTGSDDVSVEEKPEARKAGGVYYTPDYIVDYIVENTVGKLLDGKTPEEAARLRILDPACGSGSFLVGAYQYLLDWHLETYRKQRERYKNRILHSPDGIILKTREKKRILLNNIYGVDLDPNAVEVSKLSLLLKMLEGENEAARQEAVADETGEQILPDLGGNIKCGNSLIGSDFYAGVDLTEVERDELYRVNPFDWESKAGFGAIMAAGGFDAVIGNPPYGATLEEDETEYLSRNYRLQNYQLDTYLLFVEKSKSLAAKDGLIGVIIPNTWLLILMSTDIRKYLINNTAIVNIVHYMNYVFKDATVDTQVNIFQNSQPHDNHEVKITIVTKSGETNEYKLPQSLWKERDGQPINIFFRAEFQQIVDKVRHCPQLDTLFKTTQGTKPFQTGKGKPKQSREIVRAKPFVSEVAKDITFRPLLRGSLIHRYQNRWAANYFISFGDWLAEPRYSANYDAPQKIVIRQTGDSLIATLDEEQFIVRDNLYTIVQREKVTLSLKYLLGLLNSKIFRWYYQRVINYEVGEALAQVKRGHIAQLPVRAIDFENPDDVQMHDEMVKLVDEMLDLHRQLGGLSLEKRRVIEALIERTDRAIDGLVYRLYGLSPAEIAIVEGRDA